MAASCGVEAARWHQRWLFKGSTNISQLGTLSAHDSSDSTDASTAAAETEASNRSSYMSGLLLAADADLELKLGLRLSRPPLIA